MLRHQLILRGLSAVHSNGVCAGPRRFVGSTARAVTTASSSRERLPQQTSKVILASILDKAVPYHDLIAMTSTDHGVTLEAVHVDALLGVLMLRQRRARNTGVRQHPDFQKFVFRIVQRLPAMIKSGDAKPKILTSLVKKLVDKDILPDISPAANKALVQSVFEALEGNCDAILTHPTLVPADVARLLARFDGFCPDPSLTESFFTAVDASVGAWLVNSSSVANIANSLGSFTHNNVEMPTILKELDSAVGVDYIFSDHGKNDQDARIRVLASACKLPLPNLIERARTEFDRIVDDASCVSDVSAAAKLAALSRDLPAESQLLANIVQKQFENSGRMSKDAMFSLIDALQSLGMNDEAARCVEALSAMLDFRSVCAKPVLLKRVAGICKNFGAVAKFIQALDDNSKAAVGGFKSDTKGLVDLYLTISELEGVPAPPMVFFREVESRILDGTRDSLTLDNGLRLLDAVGRLEYFDASDVTSVAGKVAEMLPNDDDASNGADLAALFASPGLLANARSCRIVHDALFSFLDSTSSTDVHSLLRIYSAMSRSTSAVGSKVKLMPKDRIVSWFGQRENCWKFKNEHSITELAETAVMLADFNIIPDWDFYDEIDFEALSGSNATKLLWSAVVLGDMNFELYKEDKMLLRNLHWCIVADSDTLSDEELAMVYDIEVHAIALNCRQLLTEMGSDLRERVVDVATRRQNALILSNDSCDFPGNLLKSMGFDYESNYLVLPADDDAAGVLSIDIASEDKRIGFVTLGPSQHHYNVASKSYEIGGYARSKIRLLELKGWAIAKVPFYDDPELRRVANADDELYHELRYLYLKKKLSEEGGVGLINFCPWLKPYSQVKLTRDGGK
jgi:hypothetical protein